MTKFIGVDLGSVKCGFSIGNDITRTARPLATAYLKDLEGLEEYLYRLSMEHGVSEFVLGDPTLSHPRSHPLEEKIKALKLRKLLIQEKFNIKIQWVEESYTSQLATDLVKEHPGHSRDAFAATIILQSYLNQL